MLIINAKALLENRFTDPVCIRTENGKISEIAEVLKPCEGEEVFDARGQYVLPGFVDVHTHAYGGHDAMNGEDDVRFMSRSYARLGVAAFLPTTMSAGIGETAQAVEGIRQVMLHPEKGGAAVAGAHMEAPFLNPEACGAQRAECLLKPDPEAFMKLCEQHPEAVRMITLAPELEGACELIPFLKEKGITVSAGHTHADAETVHRAADLGLDHCTHTFNAQPPLHHRKPGITGAALSDNRIYCEMICDGFHLHPDTVRLIKLAKGTDKAVVITDSMEAAGMPDGEYSLGGQRVTVKGKTALLDNGTIAGSTLTMPVAFRNLISWGIAPEDAARMCTSTPADSVGLKEYGRLRRGCFAFFTVWNENWDMITVLDRTC